MKNFYKKGITLLEILVAIAVLSILIAVVFPNFTNMREKQALKNGVEDIMSSLRTARSETLASVNSSEYGVYFEAQKIVIFKGKNYVQNNASNIQVNIITPASISNVTLGGISGSSGELYFERISGDSSKSGSVTISTPRTTKRIDISPVGALTLN